jgi:spore germination protein YaaH
MLIAALLLAACASGSAAGPSRRQPTAGGGITNRTTGKSTQGRLVLAGYLPISTSAAVSLGVANQHRQLAEVSPVLYTVDPSGAVTPTTKPDRVVEQARHWQMSILPVIQNLRGGDWDASTITAILNDQQRRAHHIQAIMDMVQGQDWNGIDIDYEQLDVADTGTYMTFLRQLATELHHRHKLLAVAVPAKTAESADDPQSQAYRYDQIASVADEIRVMAYDHAWEESPPGSVAPSPWVQQVLNYAVRSVPPDKLMLGIAAYGYDWADGRGHPIGATSAAALAAHYRATVSWDETSASAWFRYTSGGTRHTVWFESARAMASKMQLANEAGVRGVTIWKLGDEDPAFWTAATTN